MTTHAELLALAEAATPGPWKHETAAEAIHTYNQVTCGLEPGATYFTAQCHTGDEPEAEREDFANGAFIAAANPTTVKALVEMVRELERELAKYPPWPKADRVNFGNEIQERKGMDDDEF